MADLAGWLFEEDDLDGACAVAAWEAAHGEAMITLVYAPCFHRQVVDKVPRSRKKWLPPRTCPGCNRKRRVCEIHQTPDVKEENKE